MAPGHTADNFIDEPRACIEQDGQIDMIARHTSEAALEFPLYILVLRGQHFMHRPIVADEVHEKRLSQVVVHSFVLEQLVNVEQIARVLAIECRDDLAAKEIGEGKDVDFGEPVVLFDRRRYASALGVEKHIRGGQE